MASLLLWALAGAVGASVLALIPALHIYNVAGLLLLLVGSGRLSIGGEPLAFLFLGMVTGYAMVNTIPSVFFSAPDESMIFVVLPGQTYLLQRRGYEAVVLTGLGSLGGLAALVAWTPVASRVLPAIRQILQPHLGWLLWAVIAYYVGVRVAQGDGPCGCGEPCGCRQPCGDRSLAAMVGWMAVAGGRSGDLCALGSARAHPPLPVSGARPGGLSKPSAGVRGTLCRALGRAQSGGASGAAVTGCGAQRGCLVAQRSPGGRVRHPRRRLCGVLPGSNRGDRWLPCGPGDRPT